MSSQVGGTVASPYLANNVMQATRHTLALVSTVLLFDIAELWYESDDGELKCTFIYAHEGFKRQYPDIITGHYPEHRREHKRSPTLISLASASPSGYFWNTKSDANDDFCSSLVAAPVSTELAYKLEVEGGAKVYVVAFAMEILKERKACLKFLSGLGIALFVAAYDLDEPVAPGNELLDEKGAKPLTFRGVAAVTLREAEGNAESGSDYSEPVSDSDVSNGKPRNHVAETPQASAAPAPAAAEENTAALPQPQPAAATPSTPSAPPPPSGVKKSTSTNTPTSPTPSKEKETVTAAPPVTVLGQANITKGGELDISSSNYDASLGRRRKMGASGSSSEEASTAQQTAVTVGSAKPRELKYWVPAWEPLDDWAFPVAELPVLLKVPSNLTMDSFTGLRHIGDGSNSNIYLGYLAAKQVIVKMIKEAVAEDDVACHEFDMEHGILARLNHPNIIKIIGAGHLPRRFVVVEYLGGGSLNAVLAPNVAKPGFAQKLFRKPTFTYPVLLQRARDLADSLDYLHRRFFPGCCLIHRDLKPDNIGFTGDGILKVFDFGLCTLVRTRTNASDTYEMTGNTGSLRYMAPEVCLQEPYTEKCDVYSYGIMLWQMARDRVPFQGYGKNDFIRQVVELNTRPKIDRSWPPQFINLVTRCWDRNPHKRPSFKAVVAELDNMIAALK